MPRSSASARTLTEHDEIRRWAEDRSASPACVRGTGNHGDIGMIRLDFPGYSGGQSLQKIDWDEWFDKFDNNNLALLVQDQTASGEQSNFNKLVNRENAPHAASKGGSRSQSRTRSTSASTGEEYVGTDLDEDVDEDFEEEVDVAETRPVRVSGAGNSRNRKRQARTTAGSSNARSSRSASARSGSKATARRSGSQSGRGRSSRRTAARSISGKRAQSSRRLRRNNGKTSGNAKKTRSNVREITSRHSRRSGSRSTRKAA